MTTSPQSTSRRKLLAASGSIALLGAAGCLGDDDDGDNGDEDNGEDEPMESTVTLLVEGVGGHDDDDGHDDDHDDDGHDDHDDDHGVDIDHACGHTDYDESESLTAGSSAEDAPTISETHQPYEIMIEGEEGYVGFESDEDGTFAFFTDVEGTLEALDGHTEHEESGVDGCDEIAAYHVVDIHEGTTVLRLASTA